MTTGRIRWIIFVVALVGVGLAGNVSAQLTDTTQTPNAENAGIRKSLQAQVGAGRGSVDVPGSSLFLIQRGHGSIDLSVLFNEQGDPE